MAAAAVLWLAGSTLRWSLPAQRPWSRLASPAAAVLAVLALLAVVVVATLLGPSSSLSFWGTWGRSQGAWTLGSALVLLLIVRTALPGEAGARRLFWAMALTTVPLALYGAVQLLGPDPLGVASDARSPVFATLGRSNFLGAYVALLVPLTLSLRQIEGKAPLRLLAMVLIALQVALVGVTQTRASALGLFVGVLCWAALRWRHRLASLARSPAALFVGWGGIAVLLAVAVGVAQAGGSGAARLAIWQGTQRLVFQRPLLGYGPDALRLVFPRVYPPELVYYQGRDIDVDRAHNLILGCLVSVGILGLFAAAALCALVVRAGWRRLQRGNAAPSEGAQGARQLLVVGALAALAGNLFNNLLSFDSIATLVASALLAGTILALDRPRERAPAVALQISGSGLRSAVVVACGAVALLATATIVSRPLAADVAARRAHLLEEVGDWPNAVAAAARAVDRFPAEPGHWQTLGWVLLQSALAEAGDVPSLLARAENALRRSVELRPGDLRLNKTLADFYGMAALRFDRAYLESANRAWKRTSELAPNHALVFSAWGQLRQQSGDLDGAEALLRRAVDLDITDAAAWSRLGSIELRRQDPGAALVMYRQAVRHAPGWVDPRLGLARTYWTLGQPEVARRTLQEVLQFAPGSIEARTLLEEFAAAADARSDASEVPGEVVRGEERSPEG